MNAPASPLRTAIVGGGPAGLMAAEVAVQGGAQVDVYDAMPSVGRKLLLAGKGGLNLTHSEPHERFVTRFAAQQAQVQAWLRDFDAQAMREWAHGLGIQTFVGSSGRVFPTNMKAAPLLRAWLHRLRSQGVRFHMRHRCLGLTPGRPLQLRFAAPQGEVAVQADAALLCLGGASWPRLGSDGAWQTWLPDLGAELAPLRPSNCGFDVGWSEHLRSRHAGEPLKSVGLRFQPTLGPAFQQVGECVLTETGLEGSLIYAASAPLRDEIAVRGSATLELDLLPARSAEWVRAELSHPRGSRSLSTHLKTRLGLHGPKAALLYEVLPKEALSDTARLAEAIKSLPIRLVAARPIAEAISTAGGVRFSALDEGLMLRACPGVFCAGEMLDWEAPTGGYLLTATMASARVAARGALAWWQEAGRAASHDGAPLGP